MIKITIKNGTEYRKAIFLCFGFLLHRVIIIRGFFYIASTISEN